MAFSSCQIDKISCFGWQDSDGSKWTNALKEVYINGWKDIDKEEFVEVFSRNLDASYNRLLDVDFTDLDTDIKYKVIFDNKRLMYDLQLLDAKDSYVYPDQKIEYFHSDEFKKLRKTAVKRIMEAFSLCKEILNEKVEESELYGIDEVKLEAVEDILSRSNAVDNLKNGRYYNG